MHLSHMHQGWFFEVKDMDFEALFKKIVEKENDDSVINPITVSLVRDTVKKRRKEVHKGNCGKLFIVGGSVGMTGAPCMSAMSALRCGCGLVTVACPKELNDIFEIKLTEAMTLPVTSKNGGFAENAWEEIKDKANSSDAILIGPGMAVTEESRKIISEIITQSRVPLIIDAGGLGALSSDVTVLKKASCPVIITPHIGEFSKLTGDTCDDILKNRHQKAIDFACEYGCTVVLKSHETVVATTDGEVFTNIFGNPGMATGGSGDVLSGAVAAFCAGGNSPLQSSLSGVFFHSVAGDMASLKYGEYSLIASDIIKYLAYAIKGTEEQH